MIKDMKGKINVDKRGKITTGIKATNPQGKEYPKAVDYFVIDEFPELVRSYGEKPKKLVVFFPSNEIIDFFDVNYVLYGGNQTKIRQCDGESCLHRIKETVAGMEYEPGEISECVCTQLAEDDKKRCKPAMYLKAYIADKNTGTPIMPICYLFYSGSKNTAENIYSELKKIRNLAGGNIVGIPFGLSIEMVGGKEDAKKKFPIWNLQALGTVNQIKSAITGFLFNYKEILELPENTGADTENEPAEDVNFDDDLHPDSVDYWKNEISKLKTLAEVEKFEAENKREIDTLGGDAVDVNEAIGNRKKELRR